MKIRLLKTAGRDLREIRSYIVVDNPAAADRVGQQLVRAISLIGERPMIGKSVPDESIREWSVPNLPYVIPYRISGDTIEIIRIWHTSRQRPGSWQ